jgi:hypothetical protein
MTDVQTGWVQLKAQADEIGRRRLGDLHQVISDTVSQFQTEAAGQVEGLSGPSRDGMAQTMFAAMTNVAMSTIPGFQVGRAAIGAFRDVFLRGISDAAASSAGGREAQAKDELRRVLGDLAYETRESAKAAWNAGAALIDNDLDELITERPELQNLEFDDNAAWTAGWLCDQIGIQEASLVDPSAQLIATLWDAFHKEYYEAAAALRWGELDAVGRAAFLAEMEPDQRVPFLRLMGEDPSDWGVE